MLNDLAYNKILPWHEQAYKMTDQEREDKIYNKAIEEFAEFYLEPSAEEAVDVILALMGWMTTQDIDIDSMMQEKLALCLSRDPVERDISKNEEVKEVLRGYDSVKLSQDVTKYTGKSMIKKINGKWMLIFPPQAIPLDNYALEDNV